ncbi:hypothetical protein EXN66_Car008590 [Channa argus]|uniref:Uncharacterized protein n=1 Tax=Channa argus TaxID=215402 RepID=A0A6G1PS01_CHAAH|nr:hypothetical protein EXN66_Car008590 [Channa argus]
MGFYLCDVTNVYRLSRNTQTGSPEEKTTYMCRGPCNVEANAKIQNFLIAPIIHGFAPVLLSVLLTPKSGLSQKSRHLKI